MIYVSLSLLAEKESIINTGHTVTHCKVGKFRTFDTTHPSAGATSAAAAAKLKKEEYDCYCRLHCRGSCSTTMYTRRLVLVSTYIWFMAKLPKSLLNPSLLGPCLLGCCCQVAEKSKPTLPRLFSNYFSQQFLYIFMTHITTHFGKEVFSVGLPGHRVTVLIFRLLRHITKVLNVEEKRGTKNLWIRPRTLLNNEACAIVLLQ